MESLESGRFRDAKTRSLPRAVKVTAEGDTACPPGRTFPIAGAIPSNGVTPSATEDFTISPRSWRDSSLFVSRISAIDRKCSTRMARNADGTIQDLWDGWAAWWSCRPVYPAMPAYGTDATTTRTRLLRPAGDQISITHPAITATGATTTGGGVPSSSTNTTDVTTQSFSRRSSAPSVPEIARGASCRPRDREWSRADQRFDSRRRPTERGLSAGAA